MISRSYLFGGVAVALSGTASPVLAQALTFDIPAQSVSSAISAFGRQSGLQVIAPADLPLSAMSRAVKGTLNTRSAITQLIQGTGLEIASDGGNVIVLRKHAPAALADPNEQEGFPVGGPTNDVVVTGTRASTQRAVAIKRRSDQIIDTVSASEIGQLPDFNAGDALKRVTGVNALLYQGEPRFIIVRGLNQSYNDILIDGFSLASTDLNIGTGNGAGRQISMEVLPSNLASHIDVVKSALPSTEANFIGGLTNFVSASAFDFKRTTLSAGFKGGASLDANRNGGDHFNAQGQIAGATRFGPDQQFGLYLSATYWQRRINVPQLETGGTRNWYTANGALTATPYGGTGYAVPSQRLYYNYQNGRSRFGLQGRLDWRPTDAVSAWIAAYRFDQREDSFRHDLNAAVQTSATVSGQTPTSGTLSNVSQSVQLGRYRWRRHVSGLYGRTEADLGGAWRVDSGASWSHSRVTNPQTIDLFTQPGLAFRYDTSNLVPTFTAVNPTAADDLTRYPVTSHREELYSLREDRYDIQANLGYNAQARDRGFGVLVGGRFTVIDQDVTFDRTTWTGLGYTLANAVDGTLCGYLCDMPIPAIDPDTVDDLFAAGRASAKVTTDVAAINGGTYRSREDVAAGFVQLQLRTDALFVAGGVRVEHTRSGSSSTQATNGVYSPVSAHNDYTDILPSLGVTFDTSASSKLRFGVSRSLGRPGFGASSLRGGVLSTTTSPPRLTTGNPDLKPRRATNLDVGHDWYLSGGRGLLSVAGFYKWISDDIFTYGQLQTIPDVPVPVLVTQARNTDRTVRVYGVEVGASHDLTFLPAPFDGIGISANATLSRAYFPVTLTDQSIRVFHNTPDQPAEIYNASIYYDRGALHGRFAWNHLGELWDDRFPNFSPTGFYANRFQQPTDNFDLQLSYDITRQIKVSFDALNLTRQGMEYRYGRDQELLQSTWKLPTQVLVGLTLKL